MGMGASALLRISAVAALIVAGVSCGDDGPKTLSADDLVSEINGICRDADRTIGDLDEGDSRYYDDVGDAAGDALAALTKLKPAGDSKRDVDDLVDNIGDQLEHIEALAGAVADDDPDAAADASEELATLQEESDELTGSLESKACFGVDSFAIAVGPSPEEFAAQMDELCASLEKNLKDLDFTDIDTFFSEAQEIVAASQDAFGALEPPPAAQADFEAFLEGVEAYGSAIAELAGAEFDALDAAEARLQASSAALGADGCVDVFTDDDETDTTDVTSDSAPPSTDSVPTAASTPTSFDDPDDFAAAMDAICQPLLEASKPPYTKFTDLDTQIKAEMDAATAARAALGDLVPPEESAEEFGYLLPAFDEYIRAYAEEGFPNYTVRTAGITIGSIASNLGSKQCAWLPEGGHYDG